MRKFAVVLPCVRNVSPLCNSWVVWMVLVYFYRTMSITTSSCSLRKTTKLPKSSANWRASQASWISTNQSSLPRPCTISKFTVPPPPPPLSPHTPPSFPSPTAQNDELESSFQSSSLSCRILNLFAEENAVEDTIYYLSEGLRKEAISVEVFLKVGHCGNVHLFLCLFVCLFVCLFPLRERDREGYRKKEPFIRNFMVSWNGILVCYCQHVRTLSRKQFMLRALLQKARKTAGLG